MSEENVQVVRRVMDAWNRRDAEAILVLIDEEAEYVNAPMAVEPGTRRGRSEVAEVFRKQWAGLGDAVHEIVRAHDRGDEILTEGLISRSMPGADTRIENRALLSWTVLDRRVKRVQVLGAGHAFHSALEAAGLAE